MASIVWVKTLNRWRVRWRATNRKTHEVFSGSRVFTDKAPASRFWAEMEAQEQLWRYGEANIAESIAEATSAFEQHCKQHTARTQGHYRSVMGRFRGSLPKSLMRVQQIDAKCIQEYLYKLRDLGNTNRTLNTHLTVIKAFCRFAANRYDLPNPASKVAMLTEDPPNVRFITKEEFDKLIAVANNEWRDRILFLAHTGLRASEFCGLIRYGRITPQARVLVIVGKGRRKRAVPLNRTCREIIGRAHIYRAIGRVSLYRDLVKLAERAGIERLGPHALRHYCATQMLLRGVPIAKVAEVLSHSIRVCESTYKHILPADLEGTTNVLDEQTPLAPF